jgi:hypothetical protein
VSETPRAPVTPRGAALGWVSLGSALSVWGASVVAPGLALAPRASFACAFVAVTVEMLAFAFVAPTLRPRVVAACVAACVVVLALVHGREADGALAALLSVALGVSGALLGAALGGRIEKPGQLSAVALVSGVADLWSVFDPEAPSARLARETLAEPARLTAFALPFALAGTPLVTAIIGVGDLLFAALYVAAFRAHGLSTRRVLGALFAAFITGLFGLLLWERPLPLLPLLGAAVIVADPRTRSLSSREWRTVGVVCAALLGAIALRIAR